MESCRENLHKLRLQREAGHMGAAAGKRQQRRGWLYRADGCVVEQDRRREGGDSRDGLACSLVISQSIYKASWVLAQNGNQGLRTLRLSLALTSVCCVILVMSLSLRLNAIVVQWIT